MAGTKALSGNRRQHRMAHAGAPVSPEHLLPSIGAGNQRDIARGKPPVPLRMCLTGLDLMAHPLHITVHVRWPWVMLALLVQRRLALFFVRMA